jgi:hypothetical protein
MRLRRLIVWLTVAALSANLVALPKPTPHTANASSDEPFRSFRALDAQLTILTNQLDALKKTDFDPGQTGSRSTAALAERTKIFKDMSTTAAGFGTIAGRLERLYERRHQPFGVKTFKMIRLKAKQVQRDVNAVAKSQTRTALDLATKLLDEGVVSLVLQFQAAAGGYGAVRCSPGAWTCCEPKRSKDLLQSEQVACMWGCVRRAQSCTGFLGPRIREP